MDGYIVNEEDSNMCDGMERNYLSFYSMLISQHDFYTDFNECADPSSNNCSPAENQECINTLGSFVCQCNAGYSMQSRGGCEGIFKYMHAYLLIAIIVM